MTTPNDQPPQGRPPPLPPAAIPYFVPPPQAPSMPTGMYLRRFFGGLGGGAALSALVWMGGWKPLTHSGDGAALVVAILIVPTAKLVSGIIFVCFRVWRPLGAGILCSIALGALIFFGVCAVGLKM